MRVITEHPRTYPEDPSRHFDFARFTDQTTADFAFFAGNFDFKILDTLPPDQHVVYLELEEPNRFFVPVPEFHHLDWDERFSKVFTLCPYTAAWLNKLYQTDRWVPAFYPFNERHAPSPCAKEFDVIYTGGAHGPGIERLIKEAQSFNYRFVSQTPHPAVTNANCSYSEKLSLISRSKVTIVHNLLFATKQHVEQVWRNPGWRENKAFALLPEPGSVEWLSAPADQFWLAPQLKSRLFEAAFSRSLILCQRDPWNVIERFFEPGTEFIYFEPDSLADTLREILANYSRYEPVVARAHAHAMRDYTTTSFFEKFLLPLDFAPHSRRQTKSPGNSESAKPEISAVPETSTDRMLPFQRVKSPSGSLNPLFLGELARIFGLRAFAETNTFLGNTTAVASNIFSEVHTIELSSELAAKARTRFTDQRIHVHQGDSATLFPQIVGQLSAPTLFWLDHNEGITAPGQGNLPILDEIAAIARSGRKDAVILIDDLRLFERRQPAGGSESSLRGYSTVSELHAAVREIDPDYQCFVYGDVLLAFPAAANVNVSPLIMAMTISRMFDGSNLPVDEVISAETLIAQAEGTERDALCELSQLSASTEQQGLGLHYRLWHGHVLLGRGNFAAAKHEFSEIARLGFAHWRAHWYLALAAHGAGDFNLARGILDAFVEALPNFAPARELRQKLPA
ncbi:MAG TPA: glycosyltransferase, partial [Candidatus Paceibacterota bacterium]|nr:glycosyltransferase [Candidatus Paceibacterota bacterium]